MYTYAYTLRKQGNIEKSSELFLKSKDAAYQIPEFQSKISYELGCNHFLLLEWERAIEHLTYFLNSSSTSTSSFRAYCSYQIAFSYIMQNDIKNAAVYMRKIQPWVRKNFTLDEYALRQAKRFLRDNSLPAYDLLYQQAMLLQEACKYDSALGKSDFFSQENLTYLCF